MEWHIDEHGPTFEGIAIHVLGDDGLPDRQGVIARDLPGDRVLVEWFSWIDGAPTSASIHRVEELATWELYTSPKQMAEAYETRFKHRMNFRKVSP
jgi:hypothetical protein